MLKNVWKATCTTRRYHTSYLQCALDVLATPCPRTKAKLTHSFDANSQHDTNDINKRIEQLMRNEYFPARPEKPSLISKKERIPSYKEIGVTLPIFLLHNTAHIELNAIDVSWHTLLVAHYLHPGKLPLSFFEDFKRIADDEARHFMLLCDRLESLGSYYGACPSTDSLWQSAENTKHDLASRICMTQLVQESRALDSGERLARKCASCGDAPSSTLIEQICEEEVEHVKIGVKWFQNVLKEFYSGADPQKSFQKIVMEQYGPIPIPLNDQARSRANLPQDWYYPISRHVLKGRSRF